MQYLLLIYEDESRFLHGFNEAEYAEYGEFGKQNAAQLKGGHALHPTAMAKTVRVRNGESFTTDGPFAETKEQLGGYYLVDAKDVDEAASLAAKIPGARFGCVEVRPVMVFA